ncbi:NAD(P)/FAD-dependent oxidoreductase [Paenibacillus sp. FJAT-26967]|uniref:phytoene desaturase family protein n=1 Tax=Paenibacillus sp. FJAT-26967 TaxID=1729690 RepID=UPI0008398661|nr:phytoene desaturase family protein [Paenibacillus sp. FJAT-26967]
MNSRSVIVVGAGPGGLTAAMLLASQGRKVSVFEKLTEVGGRNSSVTLGKYRFDRGPTFLNMPHILEEVFHEAGRNVHDYLTLRSIDPMYRLVFGDVEFQAHRDRDQMVEQIEKVFPGDGPGYDRFMREEGIKFKAMSPILQNKHDSVLDYLRPQFLRALPKMTLTKSLYSCLSSYFKDERLRLAFTFQAKYLGMSPWDCPGAFTILSYMEHAYGIYHPVGGVSEVSRAMARVIEEYGGEIHTGCGVKRVLMKSGRAVGVELDDGTRQYADEIILNADFAGAMNRLFEPGVLRKYTSEKLKKKSYSCSTFMIYLALDKIYEGSHHTILFADDYRRNVDEISKNKILSADPSIYVQNPAVTDPTLAPPGCSGLYVLAPVPNNTSGIDWDREKEGFRALMLRKLKKQAGFEDIESHIVEEKIITPLDWEREHHVYEGATFNLSHNLSQMMYLRPHNRFEEATGCWLVGGGTHPGSGLPTIMESARITARGIAAREVCDSRIGHTAGVRG